MFLLRCQTSLHLPPAPIYQPEAAGLLAVREAVARYHGIENPDRVVLSASTSEAYSWLFKLLCDAGDEVLVPHPSYPLFEYLAHMESLQVRQYRLAYHGGWSIDLDALASEMSQHTRAVVLVNPGEIASITSGLAGADELIVLDGNYLVVDGMISAAAPTSDARARDARNVAPRCARTLSPRLAVGCASETLRRRNPCSRTRGEGR